MKTPKYQGFTLLELLVVVAVIGFLSSISIVALSVSQTHSRDTQRKLDQVSIIKAAELYINDYGVPPAQLEPVALQSTELQHSPWFVKTANAADAPVTYGSCNNNGTCECEEVFGGIGETPDSCPGDCSDCGDGGCLVPICSQEWWDDGGCFCCNYNGTCNAGYEDHLCTDCSGPGPAICGDGTQESPEQCDGLDLNSQTCISQGYAGGTLDCYPEENQAECTFNVTDCSSTCNFNSVCDSGETIGNCSDCVYSGGGNTEPPEENCPNALCEPNVGETPVTCPEDCLETSMCQDGDGGWDLCCAIGGIHCDQDPGDGDGDLPDEIGTYSMCNGTQCEDRGPIQRPDDSQICSSHADCETIFDAGAPEDSFVSDNSGNWLVGASGYMVKAPEDPCASGRCRKKHDDPAKSDILQHYYCSSNPEVARNHQFCCYVALEDKLDNYNPYHDLTIFPTGTGPAEEAYWSVLCVR